MTRTSKIFGTFTYYLSYLWSTLKQEATCNFVSEMVKTHWSFFVSLCTFLYSVWRQHFSDKPLTSIKVTSNVLTHVSYISLMRIISYKSTSSLMSPTYKWFSVMWLPEIDCWRHLWHYPAIDAAFCRFNSISKVDYPLMYQNFFSMFLFNFATSVFGPDLHLLFI